MKIIEAPNKPIIIAFIFWLITKFSSGAIYAASETIFIIAIIIWSYLEIFKGDNWFRRALGIVVLLWTAYTLFNKFI